MARREGVVAGIISALARAVRTVVVAGVAPRQPPKRRATLPAEAVAVNRAPVGAAAGRPHPSRPRPRRTPLQLAKVLSTKLRRDTSITLQPATGRSRGCRGFRAGQTHAGPLFARDHESRCELRYQSNECLFDLVVTICFQGHTVVLQKRDGASYQGIFHTAKVDKGGFQVILKMARRLVSNPRYQLTWVSV